jgi:hypothetical protein
MIFLSNELYDMHFGHKLKISQQYKVGVPDENMKKFALYRLYTFIKGAYGSRIFFFLLIIISV